MSEIAKIKEYVVLQNKKIPKLTEEVNEYIEDGWEPLGGMTIAFCISTGMACQAMIKRYDII